MEKLIEWDEKYKTGIKEIDNQHIKLVDLINEFYWAFKQGKARDEINIFFNKAKDYTNYHLKNEENYFEKFNYELKEEHKTQHDYFRNEIKKLEVKFYNGEFTVSYEFINLLRTWLVEHIQTSDKKYINCFKTNGII